MGKGPGVALIAAGAILLWAVEIDLPYVTDDALGMILLLAGGIALVAGIVTGTASATGGAGASTTAAASSAGTGIGLLLVGSVLLWAVDTDLPYVDDRGLAVILVVAGLVTVGVSLVMGFQQSRTRSVVEYRSR